MPLHRPYSTCSASRPASFGPDRSGPYWLYLDGVPCIHVAERAAYEAHAASLGLRPTQPPIDHVAFAADDYEELAARLEAAGLRQLFLADPNGVRIELNVRS